MLLNTFLVIFIATASARYVEHSKNLGNLVQEVYGKGYDDMKLGKIEHKSALNKVKSEAEVATLITIISAYLQPCNRGSGKCVPFYLCVGKSAGEKNSMLLDFRFTELCVNDMEICCTIEDIMADPNAPVSKSSGSRIFVVLHWQHFVILLCLFIRVRL